MASAELWQVYDQHARAVEGHGEPAGAFDSDRSLYMANAHVWLYRNGSSEREVLLQTRAKHLPRKPGYLHASASGHVNLGEQPIDAAIRETQEELGIDVAPESASLLFMQQGGPRGESFNYIYACDGGSYAAFSANPNEVESIRWVTLYELRMMAREHEKYKLINLGQQYFDRMLSGIEAL